MRGKESSSGTARAIVVAKENRPLALFLPTWFILYSLFMTFLKSGWERVLYASGFVVFLFYLINLLANRSLVLELDSLKYKALFFSGYRTIPFSTIEKLEARGHGLALSITLHVKGREKPLKLHLGNIPDRVQRQIIANLRERFEFDYY
ncbi:MAG: hypothetical protein D6806_10595 [Deltaproteobacteria bacterium]|nr:MAG: hypothetical protein D6806_10595 [Deltaproteobacteria bacterium]